MKWIGAHIWQWITRFRNKVYLEVLVDDTESDHATLTVDADGLIGTNSLMGERVRLQIRNDEGTTISKGAPLYSKGAIGGSSRLLVGVCDADDPNKMPCIGLACCEMNTSSTKDNLAYVVGIFNENISGFTGLSVNDNLYVSNTGTLTKTRPVGANELVQNVGIVLKTNGTKCQSLLVSCIGRTNAVPNELEVNVITAATTDTDKFLVSDGGTVKYRTGSEVAADIGVGLSDVVDDTTPQLGGDLDVNGHSIVSAGNGNIVIDPDGTGSITLKSDSIVFEGAGAFTLPSLKLSEATLLEGHYVGFKPPLSITANQLLELPDGDGTVGQVMKTSGAGVLSWGTYLAAANPAMLGIATIKPSGGQDARLAFYENGNVYYTAIQAHDDLAASYSLYLPTADGSADQVLKTDGGGNLGWATASNTDLGSTDQTLTAERKIILDGNNLVIESTAGTQVAKIWSSGYFQNKGRLIADGHTTSGAFLRLSEATDNGTNSITLKAPADISSDVSLTLPNADGTSGQALITDGGGNLSFSTVGGGGGCLLYTSPSPRDRG